MVNITVKKSIKKGPKKIKMKQKQSQNVVVNINKQTRQSRQSKIPMPSKPQPTVQPIYIPQVIPQQQPSDLNQYFKYLGEQSLSIPEKIKTQVREAVKNELERDRKKVVPDEEVEKKIVSIAPDLSVSEPVFVNPQDYTNQEYIRTLANRATNNDGNMMTGIAHVGEFVNYEPSPEPLYSEYSQLVSLKVPDLSGELIENTTKIFGEDTIIEEPMDPLQFDTLEPRENKKEVIEDTIIDIPDEQLVIIQEPEIKKLVFEDEPQQVIPISKKSDLPKAEIQLDETPSEETKEPLLSVKEAEFKVIKPKKGEVIPEQQPEIFVTPSKSSKKKAQVIQVAEPIIGEPIPNFKNMKNSELAPLYLKYVNPDAKQYETGEKYIKVKEGSTLITGELMALRLEEKFKSTPKKLSGKKSTEKTESII